MNSDDLRKKFIHFFVERNHKLMPSAGLIPQDDPSVLFTTAGMQQFKKFYIHPDEAPAKNIVTCQPSFRTSDIEEVGDESHLTFFEMMGNFSFGNYFKKEAIEMSYEFLTKVLNIEPKRIKCTIFSGDDVNPRDDESAKILQMTGLEYKEHNRKDNFWGPTGEEGPCGPTIEFYIDDVEVWNLVFNEYFKDKNGEYKPLETKGVDTGMGLERMLAVINNFSDIYEIDIFTTIIKKIEEISGKNYKDFQKDFRIIADHIKAAVFAINDDILPTNKERGYIVRRLIRRAVVKGAKLGIEKNFTVELAQKVFAIYESSYEFKKDEIIIALNLEEEKFRKTLREGLKIINSKKEISGQDLFDLYQSFGIPLEIAIEEAKANDIGLAKNAEDEFKKLLEKHQELSRTASTGMFKGGLVSGGEMATKYHTATHLLLSALRSILGPEINQKGSNITAERIRFDFNYSDKLSERQLEQIEGWVNDKIIQKMPVVIEELSLSKAIDSGATTIPGFKYPDTVKVYTIDNISKEICGGPHVANTGELGHFKIIKEESSSAGVRRIKAILE